MFRQALTVAVLIWPTLYGVNTERSLAVPVSLKQPEKKASN